MYEIRQYDVGDARAIFEVFRSAVKGIGPKHYSADQVAAWVSNAPSEEAIHTRCTDGRNTLVGVDDCGEVVAYIDLEANGHIDHLYCSPRVAGKGLASTLYDQVETIARTRGDTRLFTEASEAARRFFTHKGYAVVRRRELK
ncbi:MAG: GNAT family N-acetyltransferase, partial [Pseudomonadales bacterium]